MQIDINFSDYSKRFLFELAMKTTKPEVLTGIVDFAINEDHYADDAPKEEDEYYLEAVANNKKLSRDDTIRILSYKESPYSRWSILEHKKLDSGLVRKVAETEPYVALIDKLLEYQSERITSEIAETIIMRLESDDVTLGSRVDRDFEGAGFVDAVESFIEKLSAYCSAESCKKVRNWFDKQHR